VTIWVAEYGGKKGIHMEKITTVKPGSSFPLLWKGNG